MKKSLNSPLETILESIVILVVWVVFLPIFWAMSEANSENKVLFWLFLFLGLVLIFLQWKFLPIRHIEFDGNFIYVSNYFRKIVIAISEIEEVKDYWWTTYRLGSIRFTARTQLGSKIWFTPIQPNWIGFPQPSPLVAELRNKVTQNNQLRKNNG